MARPRETEKRRDLAARAVEVLETRGLTLPTEALARELGVNRTTLLYHFPNTGELVKAALGELLSAQLDFLAQRLAQHEHPVDRLFARMRAVHEFHRGREARLLFLTQAVAVTAGADAQSLLQSAADVFDAGRRAHVRELEEGVAKGTVRPCDPNAVVALARAVIDGITFQTVTSRVDVHALHQLFWDRVLAPLKAPPALAQEGT